MTLTEVCSQWRQHSQLLADSDFSVVEPILAARSVAQHTLMSRPAASDCSLTLSSALTDHLMELCRLARRAGNTQVLLYSVKVRLVRLAEVGALMGLCFLCSWQSERCSR